MGMGKSSGSGGQQVQMTPEQTELLKAQTNFLTGTAYPAYQKTVAGASDVMGNVMPAATKAANEASDVAGTTSNAGLAAGLFGTGTGMAGLAKLFSPEYKQQQIDAALQAGRESGRELVNQQVAGYGGAGGLGSARAALADKNLASLQEQRQGTVAATTAGQVEANRANAASQLMSGGQNLLNLANTAAGSRIGYAGAPQDVYSKYAQVVYGIPQGNTTPNFAGTQNQATQTSSKGSGFKLS